MRALVPLFVAAALVPACGSARSSRDAGGGVDAVVILDDGAVVHVDAATPLDDAAIPPTDAASPHTAFCQRGCAVAADCASPSPLYDASHYACESGACRYLGCNDDAECASTFASSAYVCRAVMPPDVGLPIPTAARNCVLGCASASDCATSAAFDADNYRCDVDACVYTGCNTDAECASTFASSSYVCR